MSSLSIRLRSDRIRDWTYPASLTYLHATSLMRKEVQSVLRDFPTRRHDVMGAMHTVMSYPPSWKRFALRVVATLCVAMTYYAISVHARQEEGGVLD